jgi:hypothetical protein
MMLLLLLSLLLLLGLHGRTNMLCRRSSPTGKLVMCMCLLLLLLLLLLQFVVLGSLDEARQQLVLVHRPRSLARPSISACNLC